MTTRNKFQIELETLHLNLIKMGQWLKQPLKTV